MNRFLTLALLILSLLPASAQSREEIIAKVAMANRADGTLSFSFTRIRRTALATKDLVSEGRMDFRSPDHLRWEITGPVKSLFILNGQQVLTASSRGRRISDLTADRRFQSIARNVGRAAAGSPVNEKDFKIDVLSSGSEWTLKMTPLRSDLAGLFKEIILTADSATALVRQVILRDANGDTTTLLTKDIQKGGIIPDETFAIAE